MNEKLEYLKKKANSLPQSAGVYLMKDKSQKIIYIGKAKSLKNRVTSYFLVSDKKAVKTKALVENVEDFDTIIVNTEFEALLLEANLIKKHKPKYNILLKDDKGYPFIKLQKDRDFPFFEVVASRKNDKALYFGPFSGRSSAYKIIDSISRAFLLPTCKGSYKGINNRPCLNKQIGRCQGVCDGNVNKQEYKEIIENAISVFSGNISAVDSILDEKMQISAENLDFERAAYYRDAKKSLKALKEKQIVVGSINLTVDVVNYYYHQDSLSISIISIKNGNLYQKHSHIIKEQLQLQIIERLEEYIHRYYEFSSAIPSKIYLPQSLPNNEITEQYLKLLKGSNVSIKVPKKGEGLRLLELALNNAKEYLLLQSGKSENAQRELLAFCKACQIEGEQKIIEMYDVSHTSGANSVCTSVVFENGVPNKSKYRVFSTENTNDDYKNMATSVKRRLTRFLNDDEGFKPLPDLIVLDGGRGQLNAVAEVLDELKLKINIVALKKDSKHTTKSIVLPNGREFNLSNDDLAKSFAVKLQNESHRFSIKNHRNKMSKTVKSTSLTSIKGIGKEKEKILLSEFSSIAKIKKSGVEELSSIKGITKQDAINIREFYNNIGLD